MCVYKKHTRRERKKETPFAKTGKQMKDLYELYNCYVNIAGSFLPLVTWWDGSSGLTVLPLIRT